jgi:hypothetical protein
MRFASGNVARELQTSYGNFRRYFWQQQGVETAKIPKNATAFRKPHNSTEVSQIWGFQVKQTGEFQFRTHMFVQSSNSNSNSNFKLQTSNFKFKLKFSIFKLQCP